MERVDIMKEVKDEDETKKKRREGGDRSGRVVVDELKIELQWWRTPIGCMVEVES